MHYAENAGVSIAYQVFGDGPRDLLFVCGTMSHLELWWSAPLATAMLERLSQFCRVIVFDKPGTGLSDPIPAAPTIEQRTADLITVLDAAGSERAVLLGYSEGGLPSIYLAATRPQRVEALILLDALCAMDWAADMHGVTPEMYDHLWEILNAACRHWGTGILTSAMAPTLVRGGAHAERLAATERACMSPGMARSVLQGYHGQDVRDAAALVRAPTLVMHSVGDELIPMALGKDIARRIAGATFVELRGPDHFVWLHNSETVPDLIEQFLTGGPAAPHDDDRILTTIVFTDIVDSTQRLTEAGDAAWRAVLADHDLRMDALLHRFGGEPVKHTGDGRLVHFARPARAVRFAQAMVGAAQDAGLEVRCGIHTGECEVVTGDLVGIAVHIAARISAQAGPGEVLVSSTVRDLVVGSGLRLVPIGAHTLKGAPGTWELFRCAGDRPGPLVYAGYDTDVRVELVGGPA